MMGPEFMTNATTADVGMEVAPGEIDGRLKQLWESNDTITRASLANFAIYSEQPDSLDGNTGLIREVTREHACRAILIAAEPDAPEPSIRSWITAHCQVAPGGRKSVCSEQITFLIRGRNPHAIPNIVFAHLDSDLPLTLWWQGPFSEVWEPHLFGKIDRLVIDSCEWSDPLSQFERLEQAWLHSAGGFSVNDLTWTRVLHLRLALAGAFDEPGALQHLATIESVEISVHPDRRLAGAMFAAWVLNRAGWTLNPGPPGDGCFEATAKGGRTIHVRIRTPESAGSVPSAEFRGPRGVISLVREDGSPFIVSKIELPEGSAERLTPCPCESPAELVIERLRRGCNTRLYFRLLQLVRRILTEI